METAEVMQNLPSAATSQLTKNQKKKKRQKLAKKYKAVAPEGAEGQQVAPGESHQPECREGGSQQVQERPSKRHKPQQHASAHPQQAGPAADRKLSVTTLPGADRPARHASPSSHYTPLIPEHTAAAASPSQQQPGPARQPSPAGRATQAPPDMHPRVDLSQAAALIHARLLGNATSPQLLPTSPAASGCCNDGAAANPPGSGTARAGLPSSVAGAAAAAVASGGIDAGAVVRHSCQVASSIVTSTDTSGSPAGAASWAAEGAVTQPSGWPRSAGGVAAAHSRRPGGVIDSDCEEDDSGEAEDYGQAAEDVEGAVTAEAEQRAGTGGPERRRRVYVYGNYHRYYGYRLGQAFGEDPRLQCFERGWFVNRRCLDVGCNEGVVTLAISAKFGCKSMMGVDIDAHLIRKACMHLREERSAAALRAVEVRRGGTAPAERRAAHDAHLALAQTWFVHADFVDSEGEPGSFDTITCLSVLKWVHLNRGDEGLEAMLAKFWRLLAPGGYLLVEPQPWRSYKAAAAKLRKEPVSASTYFHRLDQLQLRPEELPSLLVDRLGFRLAKRLHAPTTTAAGFDRPMYLFRKP